MKLAPLALLGALVLFPLSSDAAPRHKRKVARKAVKMTASWAPTMGAAIKESKRTGKPILVDFYTTWCGWCKVLDEKTYPHPTFVKEAKNWVLLKVDAEKSPALAEKYAVSGYPTIVFLRSDGTMVKGVSGYHPPVEMVKEMRTAFKEAAMGQRT